MKKTIMTMTTVAVVGLSSAFFSSNVHAETVNNLKDKQEQIQNDRSEVKANLSEAEEKISKVLVELETLNKDIERVNDALKENKAKMDETEQSISKTKEEVEKLEAEIADLEAAIEKRFEILKERMVSYQKSGGDISYLEVVFGAQSFGDFISRVSAVNKIADSDAKLMEEQEADKKEIEEKQDKVVDKLDNLKDMKAELEDMQSTINEQKKQNVEKKKSLKEKKSELVTMKEELQIKDSNLASLEREVKQNIASATAPPAQAVSSNRSESSSSQLSTLSSEKSKGSSNTSAPTASKGSGGMSAILNAGNRYIGNSVYVFGGGRSASDIARGRFDCSGFVSWAFSQGGVSVPASTSGLSGVGSKVSYSNAQPGDLVFFNTYKTNGHVGIYLGGGRFIGSQSSTGVAVANMNSGYWKDTFKGHVRRVR
ncbi:C40 family peptidase [Virgibacillus halodenitrificans]|uniref:C40 family peptidase n=2 Tax=Virgibacillus halodenitrificans TaxID=1482 RepID=A0ABR7VN63_VIRHA|nr:C40 family peptidase [Virgibacillus halodenitrificans]